MTGAVLETALEWQGCSIVFFTDDIPYEDMLRIYMFDANLTLVDSAVLGSRYSTGTFAELNLLPPNSLTFRFFGGTVWRLILLDKQEFALPFLSDPGGVSRQFKFFRHLRVEGKPQPKGYARFQISMTMRPERKSPHRYHASLQEAKRNTRSSPRSHPLNPLGGRGFASPTVVTLKRENLLVPASREFFLISLRRINTNQGTHRRSGTQAH